MQNTFWVKFGLVGCIIDFFFLCGNIIEWNWPRDLITGFQYHIYHRFTPKIISFFFRKSWFEALKKKKQFFDEMWQIIKIIGVLTLNQWFAQNFNHFYSNSHFWSRLFKAVYSRPFVQRMRQKIIGFHHFRLSGSHKCRLTSASTSPSDPVSPGNLHKNGHQTMMSFQFMQQNILVISPCKIRTFHASLLLSLLNFPSANKIMHSKIVHRQRHKIDPPVEWMSVLWICRIVSYHFQLGLSFTSTTNSRPMWNVHPKPICFLFFALVIIFQFMWTKRSFRSSGKVYFSNTATTNWRARWLFVYKLVTRMWWFVGFLCAWNSFGTKYFAVSYNFTNVQCTQNFILTLQIWPFCMEVSRNGNHSMHT